MVWVGWFGPCVAVVVDVEAPVSLAGLSPSPVGGAWLVEPPFVSLPGGWIVDSDCVNFGWCVCVCGLCR